jgi:hypothetical protein
MCVSSDVGVATILCREGGAIAPALIEINDWRRSPNRAKVVNQQGAEPADEGAKWGQKGRISMKSCEIFFERRK